MTPPPDYAVDPLMGWFGSPLGQAVLEAEQGLLGPALEDVFGQHLLQLGYWGPVDSFLPLSRQRARSLIVPPGYPGHCVSHSAELAILSRSVEAVLLPHTLEFEPEPHAVLREVERVLTAEGHVLLLGFDPLGPWGLRHRLARRGFPPGLQQVFGCRRMRDWLRLLGFDIITTRRSLWSLPFEGLQRGLVATGLERTGRAFHGRVGSVYLIKARKRVWTLTPVRRVRSRRRAVTGQPVEST